MTKIWKDVEGYEGIYQVSNLGDVRSLPRTENSNVGKRKRSGKTLSLRNNKGYKTVMLCKDRKQTSAYVHRLVAKAFLSNPENKPDVNHLDGNKSNNKLENLEWCTESENLNHAYITKLHIPKSGESHGRAVLTEKDVKEIRERYIRRSRTNGTGALAKEYGVTQATIYDVVANRSWKGVI
jgi:hypothetical protein